MAAAEMFAVDDVSVVVCTPVEAGAECDWLGVFCAGEADAPPPEKNTWSARPPNTSSIAAANARIRIFMSQTPWLRILLDSASPGCMRDSFRFGVEILRRSL